MGQAKRRGSYDERKQQGIKRRAEEREQAELERQQRIADRKARMTEYEKRKAREAQVWLSVGAGMSGTIQGPNSL